LAGRGRPRWLRNLLAACAVALAVVVAGTRVMLGVHWFTDVLAGLALGWGWLALCSIGFGGRLLRFGEPVAEAEHAADVVDAAEGRSNATAQRASGAARRMIRARDG
jgi:hypothetical protein